MSLCQMPDCGGTIQDGYCDNCGMAAGSGAVAASAPVSAAGAAAVASARAVAVAAPGAGGPDAPSGVSGRLGSTPIGSQRTEQGTRPTRRVGPRRSARSRLGAGFTTVPSAPLLDPVAALMDPPRVAEHKRSCSNCGSAVGRSRDGQPGRSKGFCPKCRSPFDFDPKLTPGTVLGGQYEVMGCLAHGGMGWIYLARDRNVNDRWVVLKGLLNAGDPDAFRAAVAEKQYLAEVEHPLIVEIYNFETDGDGSSYIVMEYVGGKSLSDILKDRMKSQGGTFEALPPDQAIAFIIEVLPAFAYLHAAGLLFCDFKPANLIQVADSIKLIDLGGVRRIDDDVSPIYGTVGYQAPEVPSDGCSIASDLFTVARTLAVLLFEFKGYQREFLNGMAPQESSPVLEAHDSLYRLLGKGMAERPDDRFQSADEMRDQLVGVLREVVATTSSPAGATTGSSPSTIFETPGSEMQLATWWDLPQLRTDPEDPMAAWIAGVTVSDPSQRIGELRKAPQITTEVQLAVGYAALEAGAPDVLQQSVDAILADDPWSWRAVWLAGLAGLASGRTNDAVSAFNTVYGQIPGELAPKLALAVACEQAREHDVARRLYSVCARTDAAFVAPARFGLARIAEATGDVAGALQALGGIPPTSRSWPAAKAESARQLTTLVQNGGGGLADLDRAYSDHTAATRDPYEHAAGSISILGTALDRVRRDGAQPGIAVGGTAATEPELRTALEAAWRSAAQHAPTGEERVRCVDEANRVRPRSWV